MKKLKLERQLVLLMLLGIILIVVSGCDNSKRQEHSEQNENREPETFLSMIESYHGFMRTVSSEELDFYRYFVERDLQEPVDEETLQSLVKEYANKVNAVFYLGNRWGLCEPYSFEALKLRMEQENAERKTKLEQGEVVYGLEEFTLEIYFQYIMDNLEASIEAQLEANADEEMFKMAEAYYLENEEEFSYRKEVVYEQTLNGVTETLTADVDMLSFLAKADTSLADFLQMADIGEIYEDENDTGKRRVVLKEIVDSEKGFENNAEMALYRFVKDELYDFVIDTIAKNNPVQFETN